MNRLRPLWRLLVDPDADGAWNLAVDEALLEHQVAEPDRAPTLRLYGWRPAALSLGRFQPSNASHDPVYLREHRIDLVRRPTGGKAVLHECERTYAVVAGLRHEPFPGGVLDTYRRIASALCEALQRLGIPARAAAAEARIDARGPGAACFATPSRHEISVAGMKLIGSAQLRRRGAFLQHGSILIRSDPERLAAALGLPSVPRGYTDLATVLGREPAVDRLDRALADGFTTAFDAGLSTGELTAAERETATRLRAWKYHSVAWTLEGRKSSAPCP